MIRNNRVLSFTSLPKWSQDNEYIKSGYREPNASFVYCLQSVFAIHTETGNIVTHLIGCLLFVVLTVHWFSCFLADNMSFVDKLLFGFYFCGIITSLTISTLFHTFLCHSQPVYKLFAKLDYIGISLLITLSFVPWIYYGFYFHLLPKIIYLTLTISMGIACLIVSIFEKFSEKEYRALRACVFIASGVSGVIPGCHWILLHKLYLYESSVVTAFILLSLMGLIYIMGAVIYMTRIPERYYPGKFDIWFNSHQIFHVFVIIAANIYYHSLKLLATSRLHWAIDHKDRSPIFEVVKDVEHISN